MDSIRLLEERDVPQILSIIHQNYPNEDLDGLALSDIRGMFAPDAWIRPTFLVVEADDRVVAFGAYSSTGMDMDGYGMYWINVAPAHQGRGYGRRLVEGIIDRIKREPQEKGYAMLSCKKSLRTYYEQFGFTVMKDRGHKFLMQLELV